MHLSLICVSAPIHMKPFRVCCSTSPVKFQSRNKKTRWSSNTNFPTFCVSFLILRVNHATTVGGATFSRHLLHKHTHTVTLPFFPKTIPLPHTPISQLHLHIFPQRLREPDAVPRVVYRYVDEDGRPASARRRDCLYFLINWPSLLRRTQTNTHKTLLHLRSLLNIHITNLHFTTFTLLPHSLLIILIISIL